MFQAGDGRLALPQYPARRLGKPVGDSGLRCCRCAAPMLLCTGDTVRICGWMGAVGFTLSPATTSAPTLAPTAVGAPSAFEWPVATAHRFRSMHDRVGARTHTLARTRPKPRTHTAFRPCSREALLSSSNRSLRSDARAHQCRRHRPTDESADNCGADEGAERRRCVGYGRRIVTE